MQYGISNHQRLGCLLNRVFRCRSKKISKLHVTGLCKEFTDDWWIPRTKGQWRRKCFHLMTSSWYHFNTAGHLIFYKIQTVPFTTTTYEDSHQSTRHDISPWWRPGPCEFPTQRPVTRGFDVFFDLRLNKRLSKQTWGWCFETPSWSSWRHYNGGMIKYDIIPRTMTW